MQTLYQIHSPPIYLPGMFSEDLRFIQITSNCEWKLKHSQACQHKLCIKLSKINERADLKVWLQFDNLNEWRINMRSYGNAVLFSSYVSLHLSLQQGSRRRNLYKLCKSFKCSVEYYSQSQKTRHPAAKQMNNSLSSPTWLTYMTPNSTKWPCHLTFPTGWHSLKQVFAEMPPSLEKLSV